MSCGVSNQDAQNHNEVIVKDEMNASFHLEEHEKKALGEAGIEEVVLTSNPRGGMMILFKDTDGLVDISQADKTIKDVAELFSKNIEDQGVYAKAVNATRCNSVDRIEIHPIDNDQALGELGSPQTVATAPEVSSGGRML